MEANHGNVLLGLFILSLVCGITAFPDFVQKNGLEIDGANVCRHSMTKTANISTIKVVAYPETYYTRCWQGWSWEQIGCSRIRIKTRLTTVTLPKVLFGVKLSCCYGWKRQINANDTNCILPVCSRRCHHGTCVAADTCRCDKGWRGYTCRQDVNECHQKNGGCHQGCINLPGSHKCGCWRGFKLDPNDATKCKDINECDRRPVRCHCPREDPQCNATCINTRGSYRCACQKGYRLNGFNLCIDIDECLARWTHKCPHKCINTAGGYRCKCFKGFQPTGKPYECEDINECNVDNGRCEHQCLNIFGTYRCRCRDGYRLHSNRRNCTAI